MTGVVAIAMSKPNTASVANKVRCFVCDECERAQEERVVVND